MDKDSPMGWFDSIALPPIRIGEKMGKDIRRVDADWEQPEQEGSDDYQSLYNGTLNQRNTSELSADKKKKKYKFKQKYVRGCRIRQFCKSK